MTVEHSAPSDDIALWITRSVAFGDRGSNDRAKSETAGRRMAEHLTLLSEQEERDLLRTPALAISQDFMRPSPFGDGWRLPRSGSMKVRLAFGQAKKQSVANHPEGVCPRLTPFLPLAKYSSNVESRHSYELLHACPARRRAFTQAGLRYCWANNPAERWNTMNLERGIRD